MTHRVLITEPISPAPLEWIQEQASVTISDTQPTDQQLAAAHAIIVRTYTTVDTALLERAPNLRVVARAGAGVDNIDIHACHQRGIPVVYTPEANTAAVAEFVVQSLLVALRPLATLTTALEHDAWTSFRKASVTDSSCVGSTLGLIGFGKIGKRVAKAAIALGMHVVYHDLQEIAEAERLGANAVSMDELLETSSVISLHVDGRPENHHLLDHAAFDRMRDDVVLVNAARGMVVNPQAAADFARSHPGVQLILDVHDPEPFGSEYPLLGLKNVILTPHIGAGTRDAKEQMSWVVRDVMRVLNNEEPHHRVDW